MEELSITPTQVALPQAVQTRSKVAVLSINTFKYDVFFEACYPYNQRNFLPDCDTHFIVFTDSQHLKELYRDDEHVTVFHQDHLGWPDITLLRFQVFVENPNPEVMQLLEQFDYIFFLNANYLAKRPIYGHEILPNNTGEKTNLTVVRHFAQDYFTYADKSYEKNFESWAAVPPLEHAYWDQYLNYILPSLRWAKHQLNQLAPELRYDIRNLDWSKFPNAELLEFCATPAQTQATQVLLELDRDLVTSRVQQALPPHMHLWDSEAELVQHLTRYVSGGFNGGTREAFFTLCRTILERTRQDLANGIIAKWHDESQLNRYIADLGYLSVDRILDARYACAQEVSFDSMYIAEREDIVGIFLNKHAFTEQPQLMRDGQVTITLDVIQRCIRMETLLEKIYAERSEEFQQLARSNKKFYVIDFTVPDEQLLENMLSDKTHVLFDPFQGSGNSK